MENLRFLCGAMTLLASFSIVSCNALFPDRSESCGYLVLNFDESANMLTRAVQIPSTDDFLVELSSSDGQIVCSGRYSEMPEKLSLQPGSYTVTAVSRTFEAPLYDAAQYGDSKLVKIVSGKELSVVLQCRQLNCGLLLSADAAFKAAFPRAELTLRGPGGNLLWDYSESRTAYFNPGSVSVILNDGEHEECLCTRVMEASRMLRLKLSVSEDRVSATGQGIVLQLDTTRNWTSDSIIVGGDNPGASKENAYTVSTAREHIGEEKVWVQGYVIGVANSTSKIAVAPPFTKNTNVVIGLRSSTVNPEYCLSVELPLGDVRDALNLVDNPSVRGKKVILRGDLVAAYYGLPGVKNVSDYVIEP